MLIRSTHHRLIHAALSVLVLLGSIGFASSTAGAADLAAEERFIEALNEIRAAEGLPPLVVDDELTAAARSWTDAMVADANSGAGRTALAHASDLSVGITVYWMKLGENVGYGPDVDVLVDAFVDSPSHYRNIVDPEFNQVGIGVSYDAEGTMWTTHRFMISDEELPEAPAPEVLALDDEPEAIADTGADATPADATPADAAPAATEDPAAENPTPDAADAQPIDDTIDEPAPTPEQVVAELYASVGTELAGLGL